MPLYYITGISGSGKSTVLSELKQHGYEAYDVDEAGPVAAKWTHNTTGYIHPKSSVKQADRTPEFIAEHSWKVPRHEVIDLSDKAGVKDVFLGGAIANEPELQDLFKTVFALAIDDNTLKQRLANRTSNDWGKNPHELEYTLAVNQELAERYHRLGYTVIDATRPTDAILSEIINYIS